MRNIRLTLAYDGTNFHGWQRQPNAPTIQACVENAIERVTGLQSTVWASGRTDAGVHAAAQVCNFITECPIPCSNLVKALNDVLPASIRVNASSEVAAAFHARYNARAKVYRYRILQAPVCSPFLWRFVYHYPYALDCTAMAKAARLIEGKHDFTSFAAVGEEQEARRQKSEARIGRAQAQGMVREIFTSRVLSRTKNSMLIYDVRGSGFLHHMVRNIVGTLMEVGRGKIEPDEIRRILKARDRTLAGPTAPALGLCLMRVEY
ncbi:MAG: tRNA pseudouridine(38-40) synthase TruA [Acidobacteria bacterium]|nr:tRNA pseudouridine(38-40) synthase TruA [Acidobacteriota bacterium]